MTDQLVSVVIPCYNCERTIEETIETVLSQTYKNIEIILVNDGSTDNTISTIKNFITDKESIMLVDQKNQGQSRTRNTGAKNAKGKYLLFLDSDDKIDSTFIEKCVNVLEKNPKTKIVYSQSAYFGAREGEWKLPEYELKSFLRNNCIPITALIQKQDFDNVNGFDESLTFFEDWELFLKIIIHGGKVYRIPETLFFYRQHPEKTSLTNHAVKDRLMLSKNKLMIYNKHYEFFHNNLGSFDDLLNDFVFKDKYYNLWYKKLFYKIIKKKS